MCITHALSVSQSLSSISLLYLTDFSLSFSLFNFSLSMRYLVFRISALVCATGEVGVVLQRSFRELENLAGKVLM